VVPFFAYPEAVRKIIYTKNAIESLNMSLRKIIKNRDHFPNDDAATKLLYLALRNTAQKWTMPSRTWKQALSRCNHTDGLEPTVQRFDHAFLKHMQQAT